MRHLRGVEHRHGVEGGCVIIGVLQKKAPPDLVTCVPLRGGSHHLSLRGG